MIQKKNDLTVGNIGIMGPFATLTFLKCILDNTPAEKDWENLHIIIDYNPKNLYEHVLFYLMRQALYQ